MATHDEAQVHVRVSREFKRAVKIYCAREGITEQSWALQVLETALSEYAPDLGVPRDSAERTSKRRSKRRANG